MKHIDGDGDEQQPLNDVPVCKREKFSVFSLRFSINISSRCFQSSSFSEISQRKSIFPLKCFLPYSLKRNNVVRLLTYLFISSKKCDNISFCHAIGDSFLRFRSIRSDSPSHPIWMFKLFILSFPSSAVENLSKPIKYEPTEPSAR